jgi:beta-glucanase (GH16 family)
MKNLLFICLIFTSMFSKYKAQTNYTTDPLYDLVFVDEFDSLGLNTQKWNTGWPWGTNLFNTNLNYGSCAGSSNFPLGYIDVAFMKPSALDTINRKFDTTGTGYMRLIHKREDYNGYVFAYDVNGNFTGSTPTPFKFTAAMAMSKLKFKYGYIEMRYRLKNVPALSASYPNGTNNAYGPNLWLWNSDSTCSYSELDIFEQNGVDWRLGSNIHLKKSPNKDNNGNLIAPPSGIASDTVFFHASSNATLGSPAAVYGAVPPSVPLNNGVWHIATCEWTDEYTKFTFDGQPGKKIYRSDSIRVDQLTNMPLIIDCYTPAFQYCIPYDSLKTDMPFYYDIDYIKVYQQKQDCNPLSLLTTNSTSYQSKVYQNVTLGGIGGNALFSSGNTHITGQDYVLLDEGFEVGNNTEVLIDNKKCLSGQSVLQKPYTGSFAPMPLNNTYKQIQDAKKTNPSN